MTINYLYFNNYIISIMADEIIHVVNTLNLTYYLSRKN